MTTSDQTESVPNPWRHINRSIRHFKEKRYVSTFSKFRNLLVIEFWTKRGHAYGESVSYRLGPILMYDFYQFFSVPRSGDVTTMRKNLYEIRITIINSAE